MGFMLVVFLAYLQVSGARVHPLYSEYTLYSMGAQSTAAARPRLQCKKTSIYIKPRGRKRHLSRIRPMLLIPRYFI